jgi:hypothetical protein
MTENNPEIFPRLNLDHLCQYAARWVKKYEKTPIDPTFRSFRK